MSTTDYFRTGYASFQDQIEALRCELAAITARHTAAIEKMNMYANQCAALRKLLRDARPIVECLDVTRTAVVWTSDIQLDAHKLLKEIDAAMKGE